ncbi:polynucleotidyl transferase, ribonuclease H-like superfamily protein [Tanacetum coccineum]
MGPKAMFFSGSVNIPQWLRRIMRYVKPFSLCRDLLKLDGLKQGRLLGLSVGADSIWDECVGVAVSNPSNELAEPYGVYEMTESNISRMVSDFQDLITKHSVSGIVVGLPNYRRDVPNVKLFVNGLSEMGKLESVPYTYWEEEDLYSKRIRSMENPFYFDPVAAKKLSDKKIAAGGMLQDYLDARIKLDARMKHIK